MDFGQPNAGISQKMANGRLISSTDSYNIANAEPEPADLQWSGQKIRLDFNLLMCYGITFLSILYKLVWGYIAS